MKTHFPLLSTLVCLLLLWVVSCKKTEDTPVTPTPTKSSEKAISTFAFSALNPAVNATVDAATKAISATIAAATDVTKLVPTITTSAKATVSPASGAMQDFTNPVTYTVTAEDGTKQTYTATVTKSAAPKSSAKNILTVSFNGASPAVKAIVDTTAKTITALLPAGTDVTKLVPTLTVSDKATVSPATGVAQDFSKAISYTVTAEDGSTKVFSATAATDAYYFANVRMTVGENKGSVSENDSSLLDYKTGRVFLLKDGAKNANDIDLVLDNYCGLDLNTPIVLKNCGGSCGLGRLNDIVTPQKWSIYRVGDIDYITGNEVRVGGVGYGQLASTDWNNLAFAADINARFSIGRKLDQKNDSNISGTDLIGTSTADCTPITLFDKVLYRFVSHEGKKGVLRVTNFGKKTSGGYYIIIDIKIQK